MNAIQIGSFFVFCFVANAANVTNGGARTTAGLESMFYPCTTIQNETGICVPEENCSSIKKQVTVCKSIPSSLTHICCVSTEKSAKNAAKGECGYQNVVLRSRIVGGRSAVLGEFPWMARLIHKDTAGFKTFGCAGFLISAKILLTAGHCLNSENINILGPIFEVQLGEHNTNTKIDCEGKTVPKCSPKLQTIKVQKTLPHPDYIETSRSHHNDIGLIQLKKAATLTDYVFPICFPNNLTVEPFEYWITGWGTTNSQKLSSIKMKISLPPFSHENCTRLYHNQVDLKITKKQICAGGKFNQDSCTGDSGGPLMIVQDKVWYALGIVSYGLGCGKEGWPGIYTNVTSYKKWIDESIKKFNKKQNKPKLRNVKVTKSPKILKQNVL